MALPNGIESHQELLEAQTHVWNHIFNFINSMSLKCAIQLGIPDTIHKHGKPMTHVELVNTLPINKEKSHCLHRLMRILIHSKFFVNEEGYWLTPASRLLLRDEPLSLAPFAAFELDPVSTDLWHHFDEWFQNDDATPLITSTGRTLWEHTCQDPRMNKLFNEAMASDANVVSKLFVMNCNQAFQGLKCVVDVGGGTGTIGEAIASAFLGLNCVVLDLPHVIADLKDSENLTFVGGDMFEYIPRADAVFMKWILHDWSNEECVKILKKCKEAIPSTGNGGKVILIEMVVSDDKEDHEAYETQLFWDVLMMAQITGKERTENEWAKLFYDSGFTSYKITPGFGLRSLIEVFP